MFENLIVRGFESRKVWKFRDLEIRKFVKPKFREFGYFILENNVLQ